MTDIFLKLFNMSVSAGWIVLAILLVRLIFRKAPKWLNVLLWGLVGVRLALPFSIKSILSLIPSTNTLPQEIAVSPEPVIESGVPVVNEIVNPVISESFKPSVAESVNPMQVLLFVAAVVWVIGIAVMLTYTVVSYIKVYLRIREGVAINHNTVICDRINTPFIMGIIKPKIYLPSAMEERYKEYVISHEEAHLKRLDYLWKPLGFAFLTVYWFNPLLWVAYILLCRDIEFACDERVILQHGEEYKALYSEALLNCSIKKVKVNINPIAFGEVSVKDRILNIFSYKKPPLYITVIAIIVMVCMCAGFLTDPVDKKKEEKEPTKLETVTSQTEDTSDTSSEPTESIVSTPEESKPTVSSKEETVSSTPSKPKDTVVSKPESTVSDTATKEEENTESVINIYDKIKTFDLETVANLKDAYIQQCNIAAEQGWGGHRNYKYSDIAITEYGTLSDGSLLLGISKKGNYSVLESPPLPWYRLQSIVVYKNYMFKEIDEAYTMGLISKEVYDEAKDKS